MTSEKLSTRKPESLLDKSISKEVDQPHNMEEVTIQDHQLVLCKKKQDHGTQLNQEEFLMNTSKLQLLSSLRPTNLCGAPSHTLLIAATTLPSVCGLTHARRPWSVPMRCSTPPSPNGAPGYEVEVEV